MKLGGVYYDRLCWGKMNSYGHPRLSLVISPVRINPYMDREEHEPGM